MKDLLNEDDFYTKIEPQNPWKVFGLFYAIAFILVSSFCIITKISKTPVNETIVVSAVLISPFIIAFTMVFCKKKHLLLPLKTLALGMFLLMLIYMVIMISLGIYSNYNDLFTIESLQIMGAIVGVYLICFVICAAIILPIAKYRQKRVNKSYA